MESESNYSLRIVPLGGLGEIGLNMTVFETLSSLLIIDAGIMFPEDYMLGIDYVIPQTNYVLERAQKLKGIVLTHGHEDHIGALPYIVESLNCPIFGAPLTLGLVKDKLEEHGLADKVDLRLINAGELINLGEFEIEPIQVTHSIVDCFGLAIKTPAGTVVSTGDFKIDHTPIGGKPIDLNKFADYGRRGVLLLMSDSTNVEQDGYTLSEREVGKAFDEIFAKSEGRIIVATFASNIHRIQQAIDVSTKYHRKVILTGKSMIANAHIAMELGHLRAPAGIFADLSNLSELYPEQVCIITTGSQGEPLSALTRMAFGDHKQVHIQKGDTVILSSKFIPGNETAIHRIINHLYRRGAEVYYETVSEIHVSGHASKQELILMLQLVKPKYFMPIHGETRHLVKHSQLATSLGIPQENILLAHNGDVIEFVGSKGRIVGKVETGRVFIDGKGVGDVGEVVLRDRRHLSENGMVIAIVVIQSITGEIVYGPDISTRGVTYEEEFPDLISEAKAELKKLFNDLPESIKTDIIELKAEVHRTLRRFFNRKLERRPVILPLVIEL